MLIVLWRRALAEALTILVNGAGFVAVHSRHDDALDHARELHPTVLLTDHATPAGTVTDLRTAYPGLRVVMLREERAAPWHGNGSLGYVSVHGDTQDLLDALCRAHLGRDDERARLPMEITHRAHGEHPALGRLTPREIEVLRALMAGGRSTVIAERLGISPHTVRTHVQNTLAKLSVRTRLEAASLAREAGLEAGAVPEEAGRR